MLVHGYDIDGSKDFPVQPYTNVHCHLFNVLLCVKARLYRSKALNCVSPLNSSKSVQTWRCLLQDINKALTTYKLITSKDVLVELELLELKGNT